MRGKALRFFATKDELEEVLRNTASKIGFKFFRIDNIKDNKGEVYESVEDIEDLGISLFGKPTLDKRYLLIPPEEIPIIREIPLKKGGVNYAADQGNNPKSVLFEPGGVYKDYEAIIAGQVNTISTDEWSVELYKALAKEFKKKFVKINSDYVSKIAEIKLDQGVRLTHSIGSSEIYDLQR